MIPKATWGLCKECYGIVPAYFNGTVLAKMCPVHGEQITLVDPWEGLYDFVKTLPRIDVGLRKSMTVLDVTNRCNLRCPGCYHLPDNSADKSVRQVLDEAARVTRDVIGLMGAEPTMREDLPWLITALKASYGKEVFLYTNGIKLEDAGYVKTLGSVRLDKAAVSLCLPSYVGKKAFDKKMTAIKNLRDSSIKIEHLSFSLKSVSDIPAFLDFIVNFDMPCEYARLRAPSAIGGKRNEPAYMSEMLKAVYDTCKIKGYAFECIPFTRHMYAVMLRIEGRAVLLVRWPTVEEVDLVELQNCPVRGLFVPSLGETQVIHHILMIERVRSGGALPPAPPEDCPTEISGVTG